MSNYITPNEYYHESEKRKLVRNEKVRLDVYNQSGPKLGVKALVMLDYNVTNKRKDGPKHHAYAATVLFSNLSPRKYESIVKNQIANNRNVETAIEETVKQLLNRDDVVFIQKDDVLMAHPLVKHKIGEISGTEYDGGEVNDASAKAIETSLRDVNGNHALATNLDIEPLEQWNEEAESSFGM